MTLEELLADNESLRRERDQWKYTAEIRQQHLEYTIKAQAGKPVGYHFSYTTPFGHVVWDIDYTPRPDAIEVYPLVRAHPTTEPVKVSEPVMPAYGQITWQKLIDAIGEATGVAWEPDDSYYIGHQPVSINMNSLNRIVSKFSHPTTERRETLLDAHARQVEAEEDGEPVAWMNKRGDVISAEEKSLIIENGKLGHPGGEFDLHAKNIERSYTIPLGVINV